ncbi:MAG: hypothetical protein NZ455_07165 [Bacteroidia bacterium]|nr:hypothetical protein [Bacteroidia bacterium]MDW8346396.1 hypothetical protein [Bacteroidia bacterium]
MREACGGWALAQCEAQRSTEAVAQPAARRPCLHERSETQARTRPRKLKSEDINLLFTF